MKSAKVKTQTVDEYIRAFPKEVRQGLEKLRRTIAKAAPKADEVINYGIPAFKFHGMLVFFAAFKKHYSLFVPSSTAFEVFKKELSRYETHKATIRFPMEEPLPLGLVRDIVKLKARENLEKAQRKK